MQTIYGHRLPRHFTVEMKFLLTSLFVFTAILSFEINFIRSEDWLGDGHHKKNCSSGAPLWPKRLSKEKESKAKPFEMKCLEKKLCTTICFEAESCKLKDKKYDWISMADCSPDGKSEQNCTYNCCHSELTRVGECLWLKLDDAIKIKNTTEKVVRDIVWKGRQIEKAEICNATFVPVMTCPRDAKADPLQFKRDPNLSPAGQSASSGLLGLLGLLGFAAFVALATTPHPMSPAATIPTKMATKTPMTAKTAAATPTAMTATPAVTAATPAPTATASTAATVASADSTSASADSTSASTDSTSASTDSTSASTDSTSASTDSTSASTDSTSASTDSTSVSTDSTSVSTDSTSVSTDSTSVSTDSTSVSTDSTSASTDSTSVSTDSTSASADSTSAATAASTSISCPAPAGPGSPCTTIVGCTSCRSLPPTIVVACRADNSLCGCAFGGGACTASVTCCNGSACPTGGFCINSQLNEICVFGQTACTGGTSCKADQAVTDFLSSSFGKCQF